eukprot:TRINITY_DN16934_c0_g1_i1.p1 TRINITY_DN16934_c0_g1~~TRINITY_DN16934_c0_g1_i1.p1  ORF type:complete len:332 (+),score=49.31 TRINITY_DN16934_c0_g1_i1:32-1027(+)
MCWAIVVQQFFVVRSPAQRLRMKLAEEATLLFLMLQDFGWVLRWPSLALPSLALALLLQLFLVISHAKGRLYDFATELACLIWVLGNNLWTCSELLWDETSPAGFLADIDALARLDHSWYPVGMEATVITMTVACVIMLVFYLLHFFFLSRQRELTSRAANPMLSEDGSCQHPETCDRVDYVIFSWRLPAKTYSDLFFLPWILMDTGWAACNMKAAQGEDASNVAALMAAFFGVISIMVNTDDIRRRYYSVSGRKGLVLCLAQVAWVAGNICWLLGDLIFDGPLDDIGAGLISVGALLTACSMLRYVCHCSGFRKECSAQVDEQTPNAIQP